MVTYDEEIDHSYHDDPEYYENPKSRRSFLISALLTLALALGGASLAANVNLGSGKSEFGQGLLNTSACSGASSISAKPILKFTNQSNGGSYLLSGITFSNIPAGCNGVDFTIQVYDSASATASPLYLTDSTTVIIGARSNAFGPKTGQTGFSVVTNSSSSFTINFTTPVMSADRADKFTLQSGPGIINVTLPCTYGGSCSTGDTGPGGGVVFAYVSAGFNCGPSFNSTGSPAGGLCHYLEFAPSGWSGGASDPLYPWSTVSNSSVQFSSTELANGGGYKNSLDAINQGNGAGYAAYQARAYAGNGLSDWYLPTVNELQTLITYVTSSPYAAGSPGFGMNSTGGNVAGGYWSSSQYPASSLSYYRSTVTGNGGTARTNSYAVRPVRAF